MIEPAWLVAQAAPFVCGGENGSGSIRDLDYYLWEVRASVAVQLLHWKLRAAAIWTVELPVETPGQKAERLLLQMPDYGLNGFQA